LAPRRRGVNARLKRKRRETTQHHSLALQACETTPQAEIDPRSMFDAARLLGVGES